MSQGFDHLRSLRRVLLAMLDLRILLMARSEKYILVLGDSYYMLISVNRL
jgi:hypothetical protein